MGQERKYHTLYSPYVEKKNTLGEDAEFIAKVVTWYQVAG